MYELLSLSWFGLARVRIILDSALKEDENGAGTQKHKVNPARVIFEKNHSQ
jgi:hypothetical protein